MGSDLYMEQQNFRSKGTRARWDGNDLVIERDVFYHGWTEIWRGKPNLNNSNEKSLLKALINLNKIPEKPVPFDVQLENVLVAHQNCNLTLRETVKQIKELFDERS